MFFNIRTESHADLLFCPMCLNPDFILCYKQRTKCGFIALVNNPNLSFTGNFTGQNSVLMQRTSVCRQERFGWQERWNIHYLQSFDNEATWQWSHFQMSAVQTSKRELTLHNFCLFHSELARQSKADTRNSTAQLNERSVSCMIKTLPLKKAHLQRGNTLYVNKRKAAHECLIFWQCSTEDKNNASFEWGPLYEIGVKAILCYQIFYEAQHFFWIASSFI